MVLSIRVLNDNLHSSLEMKDKVVLRNLIVSEGLPILKLVPSKDQSLLVLVNSLLIMDLGLDIVWKLN